MYAVIESGSKQYRVELGMRIQVDRLDVQPGESIKLDRVLLVADGEDTEVGRPVVKGASVSAEVLSQDRGDKIVVFKYKPKARHRVKKGFRAELTTLRISDIAFGGRSAAKDAEQVEAEQKAAAQAAEKAAAAKAAEDVELAAKLAAAGAAEPEPKAAKPKARKSSTRSRTGSASETAKAGPASAAPDEAAVEPDPQTAADARVPETPGTPAEAPAADETPADTQATAEADVTPADETPDETPAADAADETKKDG